MLNFIKNISPTEFIIIGSILLVLFGSRAFTKLGKTGGETYKELKNIKKNLSKTFDDDDEPKRG